MPVRFDVGRAGAGGGAGGRGAGAVRGTILAEGAGCAEVVTCCPKIDG